jgi:hypothetical protein
VLVPAVLGPEQREDRELEVVRRPLEQLTDAIELVVGEAEAAVKRFRDGAQAASLAAARDGSISRRVRAVRYT